MCASVAAVGKSLSQFAPLRTTGYACMNEFNHGTTLTGPVDKPDWLSLLRNHARQHRSAALGLGFALLGVLVLLVQSIAQVASGDSAPGLRLAMLGGVAGFLATALGALPALILRGLPQRLED